MATINETRELLREMFVQEKTIDVYPTNQQGVGTSNTRITLDLKRSFDVDWDFVFNRSGNVYTNLTDIADGSFKIIRRDRGSHIEIDPNDITKEKDSSFEISYQSAINNGVILQLTNAYFNDEVLSSNLATYIVSNNTELFRGPSGWEDQLNLSDISQTNNARSGFLGIIDKDGGDGGLTGEKIKSEIETLINEGKINRSLISFIAWTMKDRPNMWKNLPLWSYFISMNGSFSLNQMNVDILSQIKTHLDNSINNPTATKPTGYKFRTWAALNTWSENPVSGVFPVADDSCVSGNGVDQPLTSKLECFGRRDGAGSTNIALGELPSHAQTRLSDKTWSLPPDSELNRDLTAGNGDLPLSKFEQRTKDQIIGSASTITGVKYSDKEAFLKTPVGGIQKPNNAFVTLLDDKFINYLQDVIRNFRNVIDNVGGQTQSLGAIYNSFLNGSSPAWVDFWQVMLVMQENIERRAYVLNFVVAATDEELDQRAIDIENGTRDALLGR
jgi:hypothetical protein